MAASAAALLALLAAALCARAQDMEDISNENRFKRAAVKKGITLTFVFDSTGSMSDEINQVKEAMQGIFDYMKSNRANEIADFALVEFNDPYAKLMTKTADASVYRKSLNNISVRGGGDCPEMAMEGIKIGLQNSNPGSYLFVFTDASAKDYSKQAEIENLIQRTKSKVIFVLTGKCKDANDPAYQVYHRVAEVANGQVFNLLKNEVHKVLNFVKVDTGKKDNIYSSSLPPNKRVDIPTVVDPTMTKFTVILTGPNPKVELTDPTGKKEEGNTTLKLDSAIAKEVTNPKPGNWTVSATVSKEPGHIGITAESNFNFIPGFSLKPTEELAETAPRPLIGTQNSLLIQVTNQTGRINLVDVKIKNRDGTVLKKMTLHPVKGKNGTYRADMFLPPTSVFFLEVFGRDSRNNGVIRVSDSGITPQSPAPPIITMVPELTATLKYPFTLTCHVESLVPFTASWNKGGVIVASDKRFLQSSKVLYNISSTQISSEGIYTCKAKNVAGEVSRSVSLKVQSPPPSVKTPKTTELTATKPGEISCQVESDVPYTVTWTKKASSGSMQNVIGSKFTTRPTGNLIISSVEKSDEGEYQCSAKSKFGTGESHILVKVTEPVKVIVTSNKFKFKSQEQLEIACTASGSEPISLIWKKDGKNQDSDTRLQRPGKNQVLLKIHYAKSSDAGTYACEASNKINKASGTVELKYLEKPRVKIDIPSTPPLNGTRYTIQCLVKGSPQPTLSWSKDGKKILPGGFEQVLPNGTLIFPRIFFNHSGQYQCSAENEVAKADAKQKIDVVAIPYFDESEKEIYVKIYENKLIICNANGYPQPTIKWQRKDGKPLSKQFSKASSCSMTITKAHPEDGGTYVVTAANKFGIQKKEFNVHITGMVKPVLASGRREEHSIAGRPKELICSILQGNPPPELKWYKDGAVLEHKDLLLMESKIFPNGSLIFSYIKPDSEGTYECEATNVVGKTRRQITLKVLEPPVFIDDRHVVLRGRIGSTVPLSCEVYGNPKPVITWMKDNKPLASSPSIALDYDGYSLLIMSKFENNGTYECIAVNAAGRSKKKIDLLIQDVPRISPPSSTDIYIGTGEDLTLLCEVKATPVAKIKWYKNGSPFEMASVRYSENNSSISLTTDLSSSGEYTCIATNEAGQDKIAINVTVTVAPQFEEIEEYIQASRGDNVTLSCHTDAVPPADYYWQKIHDTDSTPGDSIITFENVDESFAGLYRCDVTNIAGDAQKTFVVTIYEPPTILAELPKTQIIRKGSYFNMPCYATGDPYPSINWLKNGKPLTLHDSGLLEMYNVTEDDAGIYTCVAENYEGTDEKNMQIIVEAPPVMDDKYAKLIEVNESSSVIVSCPAISGAPTPTVQWLKDGKPVGLTTRVTLKDKNRSIYIKRARTSDRGVYTCLASNGIGQTSAKISVDVLIAPRFLNGTTNVNISQTHGTTLFFDCSNYGKPTPEVTWFRNNHPFLPVLNSRARISKTDIIIKNSTLQDQATYKCVVENKAGRIERTFSVTVFVTVVDEGFVSETTEGTWESWSPWTSCSKTCGKSEKVRYRKCSSPTAVCKGKSEQWQQCFVAACKVDGDWGPWGNWSTCSLTCGSGVRFRERFCNNPPPEHGGKFCFGANRQSESCNSNPCPVDGSWSNWSAWQTCGGPCSNSTTKRTRKCANPIPAFGGKTCSGSKVEYKPCVRESCPVHGGWSEWSPWSSCSATCGHSSSFRERSCNNPKPKMNGAICTGTSRETRECDTRPCDDIPTKAQLKIKGFLNGQSIPETIVNANITDMSAGRLIEARTSPTRRRVPSLWFPYLSLVMSPVTWSTALQNNKAVNGYTLTKGIFNMQTFVKFTSGEDVTIDHIGEGVGPDGVLKFHVDIQGRTPLFRSGSPVKLEPYEEDYIQSGAGELFTSASSTIEGSGTSIPFSWNKTIKYNPHLGKLPTLIETLKVQNIKTRKLKMKEEGSISTNLTATCPKGFELTEAGFCQDINECSSRHLHNCHFTQKCENHRGGYTCTCPPGFKASAKGGKCTDVNECSENPFICSHKCVNLEGSFKCLCPPGLALLDSKTNCSSILPYEVTGSGKVKNWKHCLPKQIEVDGMCQDEDPCKKNLHMCGEEEICVTMHGLYRCISVACPPGYTIFKGIKDAKSCIKYCNVTKCETGAKYSETVTSIILTPGGPIAPFKDLVHLPLNIEEFHLPQTSYQVVENDKGKSFRVKTLDGNGSLYSTAYLPPGEEYRIIVQALTYDASSTEILFSNKYTVIIHSLAD